MVFKKKGLVISVQKYPVLNKINKKLHQEYVKNVWNVVAEETTIIKVLQSKQNRYSNTN